MLKTEDELRRIFGEQFKKALKRAGLSNAELSRETNLPQSSISLWSRGKKLPTLPALLTLRQYFSQYFTCTIDWLLGFDPTGTDEFGATGTDEFEHCGIRWVEKYPRHLYGERRSEIELGIRLLRSLLMKNLDLQQVLAETEFSGMNLPILYSAFKVAICSGCFQLTQVPRDKSLESDLKNKFNLHDAYVASIPEAYDAALIRAELVAFLAASEILQKLNYHQGVIGIGGGYTLLRMAELSIPSLGGFHGTKWLPLIAYAQHYTEGHRRSAQFITRILANRHAGSEALYFPYIYKGSPDSDRELEKRVISEFTTDGSIAFLTVNGPGRKSRSSARADRDAQFRTADYIASSTFGPIFEMLAEEGLADKVVGEMLELPLDNNAQIVGSDRIKNKLSEAAHRLELDRLQWLVRRGTVWIVAARRYKARPTLMALRNELANAVVVDSEIAEYLLTHNEE